MIACSRLRDSGGKSFSNKKCEKRAAPFPSRARLNFAFNTFPLKFPLRFHYVYYLRAWHRQGTGYPNDKPKWHLPLHFPEGISLSLCPVSAARIILRGGVERSDVRKFVIFFFLINSESKWFPGHFNLSKRFWSRINCSDTCGVTYIPRIEGDRSRYGAVCDSCRASCVLQRASW